jgi:hypothetical protein
MSARIFTIDRSCTSIYSANDERLLVCWSGVPFSIIRCGSLGSRRVLGLRQRDNRPVMQYSHSPQNVEMQVIT